MLRYTPYCKLFNVFTPADAFVGCEETRVNLGGAVTDAPEFTPLMLHSEESGMWTLRVTDKMVVGSLPNEGGLAGFIKYGSPGSELMVVRPEGQERHECISFVNRDGTLFYDAKTGRYRFGRAKTGHVFELLKMVSGIDHSLVEPVRFVRNPSNPSRLMLCPLDTDPGEYEAKHLAPPRVLTGHDVLNHDVFKEERPESTSVLERPKPKGVVGPRVGRVMLEEVGPNYVMLGGMVVALFLLGFVVATLWDVPERGVKKKVRFT